MNFLGISYPPYVFLSWAVISAAIKSVIVFSLISSSGLFSPRRLWQQFPWVRLAKMLPKCIRKKAGEIKEAKPAPKPETKKAPTEEKPAPVKKEEVKTEKPKKEPEAEKKETKTPKK